MPGPQATPRRGAERPGTDPDRLAVGAAPCRAAAPAYGRWRPDRPAARLAFLFNESGAGRPACLARLGGMSRMELTLSKPGSARGSGSAGRSSPSVHLARPPRVEVGREPIEPLGGVMDGSWRRLFRRAVARQADQAAHLAASLPGLRGYANAAGPRCRARVRRHGSLLPCRGRLRPAGCLCRLPRPSCEARPGAVGEANVPSVPARVARIALSSTSA